ncbi:MAG: death-on-curing protein [Cocleimonas sp.]|jgi:death-on-curing protein
MTLQLFYFDTNHAVQTHDWIIDNSGGLPGTKNIGQLDSVLDHIQNDLYYPTLEEKLTHLVFSVNKFHAFNDGNKRSSLVLGAYFLELNGYDYCVTKFVLEMENIVVWVAENKIDKSLLQEVITSIVMDDDYSDILKLKIILAAGGDCDD